MPVNNKAHLTPAGEAGGFSQPDPDGLAAAGPMLDVQVDILPALANRLSANDRPLPSPQPGLALIDTGASRTVVDEEVAHALELEPIGSEVLAGVGGRKEHFYYAVRLTFPKSRMPDSINCVAFGGDLKSQRVPVYGGARMVALIGRDLLKQFVLIYHGQLGMFTLAH